MSWATRCRFCTAGIVDPVARKCHGCGAENPQSPAAVELAAAREEARRLLEAAIEARVENLRALEANAAAPAPVSAWHAIHQEMTRTERVWWRADAAVADAIRRVAALVVAAETTPAKAEAQS